MAVELESDRRLPFTLPGLAMQRHETFLVLGGAGMVGSQIVREWPGNWSRANRRRQPVPGKCWLCTICARNSPRGVRRRLGRCLCTRRVRPGAPPPPAAEPDRPRSLRRSLRAADGLIAAPASPSNRAAPPGRRRGQHRAATAISYQTQTLSEETHELLNSSSISYHQELEALAALAATWNRTSAR